MSQALVERNTAAATHDSREHGGPALDSIRNALRGLRFGTVTVIVQDGVIVQVDRTERLRLLRRAQE